MPPYQGGGDMIRTVTFEKTTYNELPYKFEAGTPNIAGAIGLGAAIDYVDAHRHATTIAAHEHDAARLRDRRLAASIPGLRLIGTAREKAGVLSFVLDGVHPHDVGTILDREGVAVRAGHHCAQPVMERFGVPATRAPRSRSTTRATTSTRWSTRIAQGQGDVRDDADLRELYQEVILDHSSARATSSRSRDADH